MGIQGHVFTLGDGLGDRWLSAQPPHGQVEVLRLAPALAAREAAIRTRVSHLSAQESGSLATVREVERQDADLRVVADVAPGTRLSDLLLHLELTGEALSHAGVLGLAGSVLRALAALHQRGAGFAHGAVTPAHVVLTANGTVLLTDGVFGSALESLGWNREQLWRQFSLALPASANLPRFDQRADVTQAAAVVLAIALRRPLTPDEYPRATVDLVTRATSDPAVPGASALRMWLLQALQLHPRAMFTSAVDAERAFADVMVASGARFSGARALGQLLQPLRLLIA